MKNFGLCNRLFGLFLGVFISAVIVNCQDYPVEYETGVDFNPNQVYDINPVDSPFQDMGNKDYVVPPDFRANPFPDPNQDPFSRENQVHYLIRDPN